MAMEIFDQVTLCDQVLQIQSHYTKSFEWSCNPVVSTIKNETIEKITTFFRVGKKDKKMSQDQTFRTFRRLKKQRIKFVNRLSLTLKLRNVRSGWMHKLSPFPWS